MIAFVETNPTPTDFKSHPLIRSAREGRQFSNKGNKDIPDFLFTDPMSHLGARIVCIIEDKLYESVQQTVASKGVRVIT